MDKKEEVKIKIEKMRHSLSHLLAMAILEKFPGTKLGIGPIIENGFYYDFDFSNEKISEDDLSEIEKSIKKIIKKDLKFERKEISYQEATKIFKEQPYKLELIEELNKEGEKIIIYQTGEFIDLCAGPHIESTKEINPSAFKLTKIAGAYWRGDEKNKQLTRVYGIAFETKEELDNYQTMLEEAIKRDHRKLGKELDLFVFSDLVGPGLPLYTPKGTIIIEELKKQIEKICRKYGFQKVMTPHLAKIDLYKLSGHADKFQDELFHVSSKQGHDFVLKPVQCPHQTQIFASRIRSYRDLPIRYMESEKQYRAEKSGEVGGLNRVYAITIEDGHSFCRVDQVEDEVIAMVDIIQDFYNSLGIDFDYISLSVRDPKHPEKYIGDEKDWDRCEEMLKKVSDFKDLYAQRKEGEAALYGPKLDFMFKDAITGKEIQIPTIQIDFATPKRFNLSYIDKEGKEVPPVMVHRAILGSYERFLALLIEHFAGAFPFWLSPIQVKILPVGKDHIEYSNKISYLLRENDIRVEIDDSDNTVGKKIREAEMEKVPFIIVLGDKEIDSGDLAVRKRGERDIVNMSIDDFIKESKNLLPNI